MKNKIKKYKKKTHRIVEKYDRRKNDLSVSRPQQKDNENTVLLTKMWDKIITANKRDKLLKIHNQWNETTDVAVPNNIHIYLLNFYNIKVMNSVELFNKLMFLSLEIL